MMKSSGKNQLPPNRNQKHVKPGGHKKSRGRYIFLGLVIAVYGVLFILTPEKAWQSFLASLGLLVKIVPIFLLVLCFMAAVDYFVPRRTAIRYLGRKSGVKGWLLASLAGIVSHGPVFVWYPMLKDLRDQGMRPGLAAVFLYNRAVKIPLLPMMIYYFSVPFVVVLTVYMIAASIISGYAVELLMPPGSMKAGDE